VRHVRNRLPLVLGLLLLPALLLPLAWLHAQTPTQVQSPPPAGTNNPGGPLRFSRNLAGDSKPIQLAADEVSAWTENNDRIFLLKGQVLIRQGVLTLRAQQAVVFVDVNGYKTRGIWRAEVYAEGNVMVDNSNENQETAKAAIDLNTRGEINVQSGKTKMLQQNRSNEPIVSAGRAQRRPVEAPTAPIVPPRPIQPAPYTPPGIGTPGVGNPAPYLPPGSSTPAPGTPSATPPNPMAPPANPNPTPATLPPAGSGTVEPYTPPGLGPTAPPGPPPQPAGTTPQHGGESIPGPVRPPGPGQPIPPSPPVPGPPPGGLSREDGGLQQTGFQEATSQPAPTTGRAVSAPGSDKTQLVTVQQPIQPPIQPLAPDGVPPIPIVSPPMAPTVALPEVPERRLAISPRGTAGFGLERQILPTGEQALIVTGGVIINVRGVPKIDLVDLMADRLVIISKKTDPQDLFNGMREPQGQDANKNSEVEFYLAGNVEIRQPGPKGDARTIRADEVYYDVKRTVCIALKGTLEIKNPRILTPVFARGEELVQTSSTTFEVVQAEIFSSRLPSDPGFKVYVAQATIEELKAPRIGLLGTPIDRKTGQPIEVTQDIVHATDVWFELQGIPFLYLPYLVADARDPLGPIQNFRFGYNHVFGSEFGLTLDAYQLLGLQPLEGSHWSILTDYLGLRGPALGSNFDYLGKDLFDIPSKYNGTLQTYGVYDHGLDRLGGFRIYDREPTDFRGRVLWQNTITDIPYGFQVQAAVGYQSDRNFLEQYFNHEFLTGPQEQTYLYVKQQQDEWAWTGLTSVKLREWITETQNLPRFDGYLLGETFFDDWLVYNTHASIGYFQLKTSTDVLMTVSPGTDVPDNTGRADWTQELSVPLHLGAFNVIPYVRLDLTGYTADAAGDTAGRILGAGGVRASFPLSRLDADIQSDLFNLDGIFHKMTFGTNFFYAVTNDHFNMFAQIDRLNDDVTDQQLKEVRATYPTIFSPAKADFLISPVFDPQLYAIRRLVDTRIDTQDDIEVFQFLWTNRWQTKRGFPGSEHIMDWMTLDLSASFFPEKNRDNFGSYWSFLEYNWTWNIGDRTTFVSDGWYDPISGGARVYNFGVFYNRPDNTSFYLGYRNIDPLDSRAITASVSYQFSPKYSASASIMYDFGSNTALNQMVTFNRIGSDLTVSLGFSYNALQNNFGFVFQIVPNLLPATARGGPVGLGSGLLGR
jgi:lipopolysaccharide export system protein LptA